jgi:hypothetical protein
MSTGVPKKGVPLQNEEKLKVTIHRAQYGQRAYMQLSVALFPKGIVNDTAITTPVPCSVLHNTFYLGLGRPEPQ